jgi:hypothetical protein
MERTKLAPKRKRPRRVARKIAARFSIAHHRDIPRGWHCPDCLPMFDLDDDQSDILGRCMLYGGVRISIDLDLGALESECDYLNSRLDAMEDVRSANTDALRKALNEACSAARISHDTALTALTLLDP